MSKPTQTKRIDTDSVIRRREMMMKLCLQRHGAYLLLVMFALNSIGALAMVFLVGFGLMVLSDKLLLTVIGETVSHGAGVFLIFTRYLFGK